MSEAQNTCTVPVIAEYRIKDGKPVMISAQYAEIEAGALLRFMLDRAGIRTEGGETE